MPRSPRNVSKLLILTVLIEIIGKMSFGVKEMLGHEGQQVLVISGGFGEGIARILPPPQGRCLSMATDTFPSAVSPGLLSGAWKMEQVSLMAGRKTVG